MAKKIKIAQIAMPIQIPGIWNSLTVKAKIKLVMKIPKSTSVNFVRKFVFVISWEVRIGSIGRLVKVVYSVAENFESITFSWKWLAFADKLFFF